jgi:hypothetical protein
MATRLALAALRQRRNLTSIIPLTRFQKDRNSPYRRGKTGVNVVIGLVAAKSVWTGELGFVRITDTTLDVAERVPDDRVCAQSI